MQLTRRQQDIITFIADYQRRCGIAPTLDEIAHQMGVSRVTVHQHLGNLESKGALRRTPRKSRSSALTPRMLRALDKASPWSLRPVSAELSPAHLTPASSEPLDLAEVLQLGRARSLVRVRGDLQPGWRDGDYLLLEERSDARDGETVVALVDGAPVIGRLARRRGALELQPDRGGPAIPADRVDVRGVVVGAVRGVPVARCG